MTAAAMSRPPPFERADFEARWHQLQAGMREARLDAILVSNLSNLRYLTGHAPIIGVAPTRPWYGILPADGAPVVVVPELGRHDMEREGVFGTIRSWPSPRPNGDEGVAETVAALRTLPARHGRIGAELGRETRIGSTWADMTAILNGCGAEVADASALLWAARAIKEPGELHRIEAAARATETAFGRLPDLVRSARTERDLHRTFTQALLAAGADAVPYLAIGSGPGGYDGLTRGPTDRALAPGDVIALDTGVVVDSYWSDFDRNAAIGDPGDAARAAHAVLHEATGRGLRVVRPGVRACDVWQAIADALPNGASSIGRFGHGVGLDYTEPPSIHPDDPTPLAPGMVLAVEPSLSFVPRHGTKAIMVHEELLAVTEDSHRLLAPRAAEQMAEV